MNASFFSVPTYAKRRLLEHGFWLFGVLMGVLSACSSENDKPKADEPMHTLIFMDKSLSLNTNQAYAAQKYGQLLDDIVKNNVRTTGDQITVYYIHENTAKARALSLTVRTEMDDVTNASPTDVEAAQAAFDLALQREKARFRKQLGNKLAQTNEAVSNQRTDILASLSVIADAAADGQLLSVYYFSDMVESMPVRPGSATARDFHKTPPANDGQADEWAKADAKQLGDLELGSPSVRIVLPFEPTASRRVNNPTVTRYWRTLFAQFGADDLEEE